MGNRADDTSPGRRQASEHPAGEPGKFMLRLYTPDADLRRAWASACAPEGFHLQTLETLAPRVLTDEAPSLVLIDASAAASASGEVAAAIDAHLHRCVWTGPSCSRRSHRPPWRAG